MNILGEIISKVHFHQNVKKWEIATEASMLAS